MAFNGSLIKVGTYDIPLSFMRYETYKVTYSTQDLDSYRDSNGELHRNALTHKVGKVEFNTPILTNTQMETLLSHIRAQYTDATEKKASVKFYVPHTESYITQNMYVPDINFEIMNVNGTTIRYKETRIAFIGY
jgi:hypothetical protein